MPQVRHLWINAGPGDQTAIYRLYGSDERLLYAGITCDLANRFRRHAQGKAWWPQVAFKTIVWHSTRLAAAIEEANAIGFERPEFNLLRRSDARLGFHRGISRRSNCAELLQQARAADSGTVEVAERRQHFPGRCLRQNGPGLWKISSIEFPTIPTMDAFIIRAVDPDITLRDYQPMAHDAVTRHLGVPADSVTVSLHFYGGISR